MKFLSHYKVKEVHGYEALGRKQIESTIEVFV